MITLPIVERELIVRARQGRTRWASVGLAALAVLFTLQFFLLWGGAAPGLAQQAGYAFQTLAWLGFLMACAACLLTVDCVSSERREGTLGLLFLTRLRFLEVVLGKLAVHGLAAVYGLMALTPVLMLPVLAGGVTWRQVSQTALSLISMMLFSLGLGIWASSGTGSAKHALKRAAIWFGLIVLLPVLLAAMQARTGAQAIALLVGGLSPATAFLRASSSTPGTAVGGWWLTLLCGPLVGLGFLVLAARALRANWREELPANETTEIPSSDLPPPAKPFKGEDPIVWLARRDRTQLKILWFAGGLELVGPVLNLVVTSMGGISGIGLMSAFRLIAHIGSAALFAYAGARFMLHGRREGALELLRTTPAGGAQVISGQWRVLRRRLAGPLLLTVIFRLIQMVSYLKIAPSSFLTIRLLSSVLTPLLGAVALCWLGMWLGQRSRSPLSAVLWPVGLVLGLDMMLSYGFYILLALFSNNGFAYGSSSPWLRLMSAVGLPLAISIKQVMLIFWARRQLKEGASGWSSESFGFRDSAREFFGWIAAGICKARHWTPGGGIS